MTHFSTKLYCVRPLHGLQRKQLNLIGTAALLFAAQRNGLIADAETLIAEINHVGCRISAAVIAQLTRKADSPQGNPP